VSRGSVVDEYALMNLDNYFANGSVAWTHCTRPERAAGRGRSMLRLFIRLNDHCEYLAWIKFYKKFHGV